MKIKFLLTLILSLIFCKSALCSDNIYVSGVLLLRNGTKVECASIDSNIWPKHADGMVGCVTLEGVHTKINVTDISSICFDKVRFAQYGRFAEEKDNVILVSLKNGKEAVMRRIGGHRNLEVTYNDSFTNNIIKASYYIDGRFSDNGKDRDVVAIFFSGAGNVKYNKSSSKFYPVGYNYDPYSGEKLIHATIQ